MFEQILYNHLQSCTTELSQHLARYNNSMAIFNQEAPDDQNELWGNDGQYGRIVFNVIMKDDPERNVSGVLYVDVICQNGQQIPETLEPIVKGLIDGYFFTDTTETIAAQWSASNYFTDTTKKADGVTLTFGLLAFPTQTTNEPDPIAVINSYTKEIFPDACIVGVDAMQTAWKPTSINPAIYWRLIDISKCNWIPDTYACSWQTAVCQAHVFAPDKEEEIRVARIINNSFTLKKVLRFSNNTTLRIDRNIRINTGADPLKQGQISVEATYGLLHVKEMTGTMKNIQTSLI